MKRFFTLVLLSVISLSAGFAISLNQLHIISDDGTYLGSFENRYSSNSVYNEYGDYGSKYSSKSIMTETHTAGCR